jgi:integrase
MGERAMGNLTAKSAENAAAGRHHDGEGLWLYVRPTGSRSWVLRVVREGKRSEIGVGSFPAITLAAARAIAGKLRTQVKEGADPLADKRAAKAKRAQAGERTFEKVAETVHGLQRFRTPALSERWIGRLQRFAFPHFGKVAVDKVDGPMVLAALQPIWNAKPETARRVRQLVGKVLAYAHVNGMRGPVPDLAEHTKAAFPAHEGAVHHPAVDYTQAVDVLAKLRAAPETVGRLALLFTIYTAARSGETRGATWGEVDLEVGVWRIPAARMKMKRDHAVPLSAPALAILGTMARGRRTTDAGELVFPGERMGRPLSDVSLAKANKLAAPGTTVHGWRSTFCDWASEVATFPVNVIEAALAHVIGSATTQAYQRGDLLAKRRDLMAAWAAFLVPTATGEGVVDLASHRAKRAA